MRRLEQEQRAEQARIAAAEREEAISQSVENTGNAIANFFGGIFGGGAPQQNAAQSAPANIVPVDPALVPIPRERINRS